MSSHKIGPKYFELFEDYSCTTDCLVNGISPLQKMFTRDNSEYYLSRIMTHRSINTRLIDEYTSNYYEAAKTLIDILDIIKRCIPGFLKSSISIVIDGESTDLQRTVVTVDFSTEVTGLGDQGMFSVPVDMTASLKYTKCTKDAAPNGVFVITFMIMNKPETHITIGTERLLDYIDLEKYPHMSYWTDTDKCTKVNHVLKYSENFPAPSILAHDINVAVDTLARSEIRYEE